jgi:hypothetical protein
LSASTQKLGDGNVLDFSRLLWLNIARQHDKFDTDEFLWVDLSYFSTIKHFLTIENVGLLVNELKHHFFYQTQAFDSSVHSYPGASDTYFNTNLTTFVSKRFFGGRREAI